MEKEDLNIILKGQKEQREFFEKALDVQGEKFQESLNVQGAKIYKAIDVQGEKFQESLNVQGAKIYKAIDVQGEKFQRHLGVVIEEQNSKIQFLAESIGGIDKKIDINKEMIGQNAMNIEIVKSDVKSIKQDLLQKVDREEFNALEKKLNKA